MNCPPFGKAFTKFSPITPEPPLVTIRRGHYVDILNNTNDNTAHINDNTKYSYATALAECVSISSLRGFRCRYYWNQFETSDNVFNWTVLDNMMDDAVANNVYFMILLAIKDSSGNTTGVPKGDMHIVPSYLQDGPSGATYQNGQYPYEGGVDAPTGGWAIRFDNLNTRTKFNRFLTALCNHIKTYSPAAYELFEGIGFNEAIPSNAAVGFEPGHTTPTVSAWFTGVFQAAVAMQSVITDRVVSVSMNHPIGTKAKAGVNAYIPLFPGYKLGMFCPNVVPEDPRLWRVETAGNWKGTNLYFNDYRNILALGPNIQGEDYEWTSVVDTDPGHVPTIQELYECAVDTMGAHYIIWMRQTTASLLNGQPNWENVKTFIQSAGRWNAVDGGMNPAYPSCYA